MKFVVETSGSGMAFLKTIFSRQVLRYADAMVLRGKNLCLNLSGKWHFGSVSALNSLVLKLESQFVC